MCGANHNNSELNTTTRMAKKGCKLPGPSTRGTKHVQRVRTLSGKIDNRFTKKQFVNKNGQRDRRTNPL